VNAVAVLPGLDPLMTKRQAAAFLAVSPRWIEQRVATGEIPHYRLGRSKNGPLRFKRSELERFVDDRKGQ
jgi:excisionase family DNA binding protein